MSGSILTPFRDASPCSQYGTIDQVSSMCGCTLSVCSTEEYKTLAANSIVRREVALEELTLLTILRCAQAFGEGFET